MHPGILFAMVLRDHDDRRRRQALERDAHPRPSTPAAVTTSTAEPESAAPHAVPRERRAMMPRSRQGARL